MNLAIVLTLIGRDRPGLVERIASVVARHNGNWLESRMNRLGGEFAGILRLTLPAARESALLADLAHLESSGLTVFARRDEPATGDPSSATRIHLELVGQDRPRIVQQIASALTTHGANVEELVTECVSAPMSGESLFKAKARLALPPTSDIAQLRASLEGIAADLLVDISLVPIPGPDSP
ncbi:MAG: glycine cleavage system protein R [Limisphaerales bacterium]